MNSAVKFLSLVFIFCTALGCTQEATMQSRIADIQFRKNNAGLTLPPGFKAVEVADSLGSARHIVVGTDGTIYIALRRETDTAGIVALRDTDGDGQADQKKFFGEHRGTGIGLHNGYLYASSDEKVYRYRMDSGDAMIPATPPEVIIEGFPEQNQHSDKAFAFDSSGHIYVNVGAPSNSCQKNDRQPESPGMKPCPLLERHAGIWRFSASQPGQTQLEDGLRYATGLRNVVGLDWNYDQDALYVTQHGRDQLYQNWSKYYTPEESAALPSETLYRVNKGDDFGWPYSYYDHLKDSIMLAPEYGGNGEKTLTGTTYEGQFERPVVAFPGHWAPNALEFYTGKQFPEKYHNGAFIAFHGSWNRSPKPQQGYKVVFVPFENGRATGEYEDFATGFAGTALPQPGTADHRPTGLATGPDGSLYVTDDTGGTVWRIVYVGENKN